MMSQSLLLVAHGSRRAASNEEVEALTDKMRQSAGDRFLSVRCAFLELAEPSIPDGIDQCITDGAKEVLVLPYFLSAGRHVSEDIPHEVEGRQTAHADVDIRILPYMGADSRIADLLLSTVG